MGKNASVQKDSAETRVVIWFSRILRWGLGSFFAGVGILYYNEGAWPAIAFGAVIFATGFFRPKRCLDEQCTIPDHK